MSTSDFGSSTDANLNIAENFLEDFLSNVQLDDEQIAEVYGNVSVSKLPAISEDGKLGI